MGNKVVVLTGNGLSVGLNSEFSLENITRRFYRNLTGTQKSFIEHHLKNMKEDKYNQLDFEESIASIEQSYDALKNYHNFLKDDPEGIRYANLEKLDINSLEKHLQSMESLIHTYSKTVIELIDGHVKQKNINEKLGDFENWLQEKTSSKSLDLFTLNYDLLLETILLSIVEKNRFMDFYAPGSLWDLIRGNRRFHFNPTRSAEVGKYPNIKLHHLHGSLSSFKEIETGRIFKITTEDLREHEVYDHIFKRGIIPSIITGGGKSLKVQQSPFDYYYRRFNGLLADKQDPCDELYIIGYSFRDEHINKSIIDRMNMERTRTNPSPLKLKIIDYQVGKENQEKFRCFLNDKLELTYRMKNYFKEDDSRLIFEGANKIMD